MVPYKPAGYLSWTTTLLTVALALLPTASGVLSSLTTARLATTSFEFENHNCLHEEGISLKPPTLKTRHTDSSDKDGAEDCGSPFSPSYCNAGSHSATNPLRYIWRNRYQDGSSGRAHTYAQHAPTPNPVKTCVHIDLRKRRSDVDEGEESLEGSDGSGSLIEAGTNTEDPDFVDHNGINGGVDSAVLKRWDCCADSLDPLCDSLSCQSSGAGRLVNPLSLLLRWPGFVVAAMAPRHAVRHAKRDTISISNRDEQLDGPVPARYDRNEGETEGTNKSEDTEIHSQQLSSCPSTPPTCPDCDPGTTCALQAKTATTTCPNAICIPISVSISPPDLSPDQALPSNHSTSAIHSRQQQSCTPCPPALPLCPACLAPAVCQAQLGDGCTTCLSASCQPLMASRTSASPASRAARNPLARAVSWLGLLGSTDPKVRAVLGRNDGGLVSRSTGALAEEKMPLDLYTNISTKSVHAGANIVADAPCSEGKNAHESLGIGSAMVRLWRWSKFVSTWG